MNKVEVVENKTIRLVNVLIYECRKIKKKLFEYEINKFANHIETNKILTTGPIIIKYKNAEIDEELEEIYMDFDIMIQLKLRMGVRKGFSFENELIIENCLVTKFKGIKNDFEYAHSKMDLYMWENGIVCENDMYEIHINSTEKNMRADIIKKISSKNEKVVNNSVIENKTLNLKNTLIMKCRGKDINKQENEQQKFFQFIEKKQIETFGPLIVRRLGTKIHDEIITQDYDLIIQTKSDINNFEFSEPYSYENIININNCLYYRYSGITEEIDYAKRITDMYVWENDLSTSSDYYEFYVKTEDTDVIYDIFIPLKTCN